MQLKQLLKSYLRPEKGDANGKKSIGKPEKLNVLNIRWKLGADFIKKLIAHLA